MSVILRETLHEVSKIRMKTNIIMMSEGLKSYGHVIRSALKADSKTILSLVELIRAFSSRRFMRRCSFMP
jgi:hypothetical protein